jgi:hypothetical protein
MTIFLGEPFTRLFGSAFGWFFAVTRSSKTI